MIRSLSEPPKKSIKMHNCNLIKHDGITFAYHDNSISYLKKKVNFNVDYTDNNKIDNDNNIIIRNHKKKIKVLYLQSSINNNNIDYYLLKWIKNQITLIQINNLITNQQIYNACVNILYVYKIVCRDVYQFMTNVFYNEEYELRECLDLTRTIKIPYEYQIIILNNIYALLPLFNII